MFRFHFFTNGISTFFYFRLKHKEKGTSEHQNENDYAVNVET